jgi:glycosyltransferase involved in cell wall biosynthesis
MHMAQLISIVIPVYNEGKNVDRAYCAVKAEFENRNDLDFEIIFTDNHSVDDTFERLKSIAARDLRVRVLRFSRNFGFNRSILTGYRYAQGDAAIQIDCDLEDPPAAFHEFIRLWRAGHDVVVGVRTRRVEGRIQSFLRRSFFRLLNGISDVRHEADAGDFRIVDRTILDQLRIINDPQPYVRGLITELARNQGIVAYERSRREFGESKFPSSQLIKLALDGVFAHSTAPLRIATYIGLSVALVTACVSGFYILGKILALREWPSGFATTTVLILFGISLNSLLLGIIGEYLARIYQQMRGRPPVIIEKAINTGPIDMQRIEGLTRIDRKGSHGF